MPILDPEIETVRVILPRPQVIRLSDTEIAPGNFGGEFIDLTDVPNSYAGQTLKAVRVNAGETGLEFYTVSAGAVDSVFGRTGAVTAQTGDYTAAQVTGAVPDTRTVNGHALSSNVTVTATDVGLGNVTNDAQTKAAIVPNTAPSSGQILAGNAGGTAYAPVTLSGAGVTATLSSAGVLTLSAIANATLSNSAITIAGTSTALGGSIALDTILGLSSVGLVKRTAGNTLGVITDSSANWDTAFSQTRQWDGGSTGLTAATGRTSLGATTVGGNIFQLTNPSAITFLRMNADNSVTALNAANFRTAIGAGTGSGDALTSQPLSQFAATTSAQLLGVISDETGSGALVFADTPTLIAPLLGTPTSGVMTNVTGTAASLTAGNATKWTTGRTISLTGDVTYTSGSLDGSGNVTGTATLANIPAIAGTNLTGTAANLTAGHVTTNANLTGPITSSGNATAIASQTGTGTKFVVDTSPTLVTPVLGVATATSLNGNTFTTGTYTLTGVAGKTLTFNKSLTLEGTDSTTMTFPTTSATIARTDAANTFTGASTATSWVFTTPVLGTPTSGNLVNCTGAGGWTNFPVITSDFTTTSTDLVDITGMVSSTLLNSTKYEVEVIATVLSSSSAGIKFAWHGGGTGGAATVNTSGVAATNNTIFRIVAIDTATAAQDVDTIETTMSQRGFFVTRSTGTATISFQILKVTSGTATVRTGSYLRIRVATVA